MPVVLCLLLLKRKRYARFMQGFRRAHINRADLTHLNRMGWPVALQMGMEAASFSVCAVMLGWLGSTALAAHQIMCTLATLCYLIYYGMGAAVAIRVSYFRGQNDVPNLQRTAYAGFHLILASGMVLCSAIFALRYQLGGWFTDSEAVTHLTALLVVPMLVYQVGDGLQITFANALRGIADVKPMMYIAFVAYIMLSIPVSYVFGFVFGWGAVGIWYGFPVGLTSAGIAFYYRFHKQTHHMLCPQATNQPK